MTVPATVIPPCAASVKEAEEIDAGFMATLKVAVRAWLIGTPVAPLAGFVEVTVGGTAAPAVLKLHTKLLANARLSDQ